VPLDRIGEIDLAIVLGSGLSDVLGERAAFDRIPFGDIGIPLAPLEGHAGHALVGRWHGKRVLAYAGRIHAYQGFDARDITRSISIAADCGAKAVLLTNAAGALNEDLHPGDLMLISDHINLSGLNPLVGSGLSNPFINMTDAYSKRLRDIARLIDDDLAEGVYACMLGPTYETTAEANFLRSIGADAVGMSTALETIAARARKLEVFGVSLITNIAASLETSHGGVTAIAQSAAPRLGDLIEGLVLRS
jgi:purine-nucleoside phosphorylase